MRYCASQAFQPKTTAPALLALESPSVRRYSKHALAVSRPFLILTRNLRIAAVCVQLKAVCGCGPLYVVFYYLTRPRIRRESWSKAWVTFLALEGGIKSCDPRGIWVVNTQFPAICSALQPAPTKSAELGVRLRRSHFAQT